MTAIKQSWPFVLALGVLAGYLEFARRSVVDAVAAGRPVVTPAPTTIEPASPVQPAGYQAVPAARPPARPFPWNYRASLFAGRDAAGKFAYSHDRSALAAVDHELPFVLAVDDSGAGRLSAGKDVPSNPKE